MTMKLIKNRCDLAPPDGAFGDAVSWDQFPDKIMIDLSKFPKPSDSSYLQFSILSPNNLQRRTQDEPHHKNSWDGAFDGAIPECVLYKFASTDKPISIRFDKAIRGVGANVDINMGSLFEAAIKAFRGNTEVMLPEGGVRSDGKKNQNGLGTAIFIGFLEDDMNQLPGIDRIEFNIKILDPVPESEKDMRFAINKLVLVLE